MCVFTCVDNTRFVCEIFEWFSLMCAFGVFVFMILLTGVWLAWVGGRLKLFTMLLYFVFVRFCDCVIMTLSA